MGVQQQIGTGTPYQITHSRNLTGALTETVLPPPTSRHIDYGYDAAGRVVSVTGIQNNKPATYASNLEYAPQGAIEAMDLGPFVKESTSFNSNLQPVTIEATVGSASLLKLEYAYCSMTGGVCSSTDNNGNVRTQTITRSGQTWNQTYSYDLVNRLTVARESGPNSTSWEQTFGYDHAGNRWLAANAVGDPVRPYEPSNETPQSGSWYQTLDSPSKSNNQITQSGWSYDNAGNILAVGGTSRTFTYDAENRQITATVNGIEEDYTYDGEGRRVMKEDHTTHAATIYVYDADGQVAVEYPAKTPTTGGTQFLTADALGSTRLVTDVYGNTVQCNDYLPFGEDLTAGGRTCVSTVDAVPEKKFTGKERDSESGLDYFGARYFSAAQGRFTSPDWAVKAEPVPYAKLDDPQSLNLYSYVRNNPLSTTDPDGHEVDFDKNGKKAEKLLLQNVSKSERKMFQVTKNADGKSVLRVKAGAEDNFKGKHTEGYNRLTTAINSKKVETLNVAKTYKDSKGVSHDVSREYGGGVTMMQPNGNSTIYVSPSGNPYPLTGTNGKEISDPLSIIMGHETLGHGLENALGGDTSQRRAIEIENDLRREQKRPERAQDPE
jgi:RHS repeat-associated protein